MGSVSIEIDLSLSNIWRSWFKFRRGKRKIKELENFQYYLEDSLWRLFCDFDESKYVHGQYQHFTFQDGKRRDIMVASVRDRVVHRLVYEYLVSIYDHSFMYDVWSCRKDKGLIGAIERTQKFLKKYPDSFVWRGDITKFFDNIKQNILFDILSRRVKDKKAMGLIKKIINSYSYEISDSERGQRTNLQGIPIGNLTSQIFANIYLNELDRFVKHILKPQFYLRYGDDFIIITPKRTALENLRGQIIFFLKNSLGLEINRKNDIILPMRRGIYFLGTELYPTGRRLKFKNWHRAQTKLDQQNVASYCGLIKQHYPKKLKHFNWLITKIYAQAS